MPRTVLVLGAVAAAAVSVALAHAGGAPGPGVLAERGWTCFVPPGDRVHCAAPGAKLDADGLPAGPTLTLRMFDTADAGASEARFLGTELLVRGDLYRGQPCPTDPYDDPTTPGVERGYTPLPFGYLACHRSG